MYQLPHTPWYQCGSKPWTDQGSHGVITENLKYCLAITHPASAEPLFDILLPTIRNLNGRIHVCLDVASLRATLPLGMMTFHLLQHGSFCDRQLSRVFVRPSYLSCRAAQVTQ